MYFVDTDSYQPNIEVIMVALHRSFHLLLSPISLLTVLTFFALSLNIHAQTDRFPLVKNSSSLRTEDLQSPLLMTEAKKGLEQQRSYFIENRGQWNREAMFLMQTPGLDMWITQEGVVYDLFRMAGSELPHSLNDEAYSPHNRSKANDFHRNGHVVRMRFVGGQPEVNGIGSNPQPGIYNYFIGNNRTKWVTDILRYTNVQMKDIYIGIDAVYYLDEGRPRYDLIVSPGADPSTIRLEFEGAENLSVTPDGHLVIATSMGELRQQGLYAYQQSNGARRAVECAFALAGNNTVNLYIGEYDQTKPLVIDPIVWSTYLGGARGDLGYGIAIDSNSNVYVTGATRSIDYPATVGAYQESNKGYGRFSQSEAFVAKLTADGTSLIYSTFLGSRRDDESCDIAVDKTGCAYISGMTHGAHEFPTISDSFNESPSAGINVFITKFSADGKRLLYSAILGGSKIDWCPSICVDSKGSAYINGTTESSNFPTTKNAYDTVFNGEDDLYVAKLSPDGSTLLYSTFLGGPGSDIGNGIAIDGDGNSYLTGLTRFGTFPTTSGAYNDSARGTVFVTKLNAEGDSLIYSALIGGTKHFEQGSDITVDNSGNAYITGNTQNSDFPTTTGAIDDTYNGRWDVFVAKLNADGSKFVYSTLLGGSIDDYATALTLDNAGCLYITGYTFSENYPTNRGYQEKISGNLDAFVTKLSKDGRKILYSTFIGGFFYDRANDIVADKKGNVLITGFTQSENYPTTNGSYDDSLNNDSTINESDTFVTKLTDLTPSITLLSPSGSELWCGGSTQTIRWESQAISNVVIELSTDGGTTWNVVEPSASTAGVFEFIVNLANTDRALIRVSDANNPDVNDSSTEFFTINSVVFTQQPNDQIAEPGDIVRFSAGTNDTPPATVQWQISHDNGDDWSDISSATDTSYSFTATGEDHGNLYRAIFDNGICVTPTNAALLTVQGPSGITDATNTTDILTATIRPNPILTEYAIVEVVSTTSDPVYVALYDLLGKQVLGEIAAVRSSAEHWTTQLDLSMLSNGEYIAIVRSGMKSTTVRINVMHSHD